MPPPPLSTASVGSAVSRMYCRLVYSPPRRDYCSSLEGSVQDSQTHITEPGTVSLEGGGMERGKRMHMTTVRFVNILCA